MSGKVTGKVKYLAGWWVVALFGVVSLGAAGMDLRLVEAAKNQDKTAVRSLLQENADVNAVHPDGSTALAWAVHWDNLETAELLLRTGADVNAANDYGITPLLLASTNRNAAMVEKLLDAGADPNVAKWTGETPLMTAASTGNLDVVKSLLAHGADVNAAETRRGQTALMWAIAFWHPEVARVLVESGADVSARTHKLELESFTPMVVAGYGGDLQATSGGGYTPLLFAARAGDMDTVRLLLEAGADVNESTAEDGSALVIASAGGYEALALFLLENGADPNAAGSNGITALHYALRDGIKVLHGMDIVKVKRICAAGAGARCKAIEDTTVVDPELLFDQQRRSRGEESILPGRNMSELMKALLARGSDPNARLMMPPSRLRLRRKPLLSMTGTTPFLLAAAAADLSSMGVLVEGGAEPLVWTVVNENELYKEGNGDDNQIQGNGTPLMVAVGMGRRDDFSTQAEQRALEAAQVLVGLGADVNEATATGWTALHAAAFAGANSLVEFLVEQGAKIDVQNGCGQTPLSLAEGTDARGLLQRVTPHENTGQLLRKLGAGTTPLSGPVGRCVKGRFGLEYATVKLGEDNPHVRYPEGQRPKKAVEEKEEK